MLSFISLSVQERRKTTIENLQAVFLEGFVYGLFAPRADLLKPLLECISGQRHSYKGNITYNNGPLAGQVSLTDCQSLASAEATARRKTLVPQPALLPFGQAHIDTPPRSAYKSFPASPPPEATIDCSKNILLLHDLRRTGPGYPQMRQLDFLYRHDPLPGKIVIITSHDYAALRPTCDYIYLFDKKRFPIVVGKADFTIFDHYFENVFSR